MSPCRLPSLLKDNILTRIFALFAVSVVVLAAMAAYALRTINRSVATSDWVNHTHATIYQFEHIIARLQQAEGRTHAYALTGDPRDLATARGTFDQLAEHLDNAKALTRDTPAAQAALGRIENQLRARETWAQSLWAARKADQPEKVQAILAADAGSTATATLERELAQLRDAQFDLLGERDHFSYLQAQMTRWVVGVGILLNLLLLAAVAWLIRDDLAARRRAATALQVANAQLEDKVKIRTADLQAANALLRVEGLERRWTILSQEHQIRYNHLIIDSVHDLVFVLTKILTVTRINPAVGHRTGRADNTILTKPLAHIVVLANVDSLEPDLLMRSLHEGREVRDQPVLVLGVGERQLPGRLTLIPLRDQDKVVGGVVVVQLTPWLIPPTLSIHE